MSNISSYEEVEVCEIPVPLANGIYMRMPTDGSTLYVRVYPFCKADGKHKLGRPVTCHWIDRKRHECTGKECPHCKNGVELTCKMEIACVDRKKSPGQIQILEVPRSVFGLITESMRENGLSILGDEGLTFAFCYNSTLKKYSVSPVLEDKTVLTNGNKLLPFEPLSKKGTSIVNPVKSADDDFPAVTAENPDQGSLAEEADGAEELDNEGNLW